MTPFSAEQTAFGRHETFPLRYGWLTKGFRNWCENPDVFINDDPTVILGVGKNMVASIRYWLEAAQVTHQSPNHGLVPSDIGRILFSTDSGLDPFLEDDTTLWLLHWLIASNPSEATCFYWYFNRYHKPEFTSAELLSALTDFVRENVKARAATTTLKNDINVLLRMYCRNDHVKGAPIEEGLDSPMTLLGLIQRSNDRKHFTSRISDRRRLPLAAFGFAVLDLMETMQLKSLSIERLMHSDNQYAAPGSVFRLSEDGLVTKLEELIRWYPGVLELRETAGIHQLYQLRDCSKMDMLTRHFAGAHMEKAA
jgi:hypothetical protein